MTPAFGYSFDKSKMELASGTGNGRSTTEFTIAKSAVFAAMHTENVSSTVTANPLARHKDRTAYFRSSRNASMFSILHQLEGIPTITAAETSSDPDDTSTFAVPRKL